MKADLECSSLLVFFLKSILPSILKAIVQLKVNLGKGAPYTSVLTWLNLACIGYSALRKINFIVFSLPDGLLVHVIFTPTVILSYKHPQLGWGRGAVNAFFHPFLRWGMFACLFKTGAASLGRIWYY